jgi:hypothetical protein
MGLYDPFEHLKHKLWWKEGRGVKLVVWLPTTKSWKSPRFPCVQVVCNIPLKSSWQELQIFFRLHFNWRSTNKIMGPKVARVPTLGISGDPGQNDIWVLVPWPSTKYTIRGKAVTSPPSPGYGESCEFMFACGSSVHQSSNYALTNLLFDLCRSV